MATRAKFVVRSSQNDMYGNHSVNLVPVMGTSEENKAFYRATPSGEISLGCLTEEVAAPFVPGKQFYIDFTEAPAE